MFRNKRKSVNDIVLNLADMIGALGVEAELLEEDERLALEEVEIAEIKASQARDQLVRAEKIASNIRNLIT